MNMCNVAILGERRLMEQKTSSLEVYIYCKFGKDCVTLLCLKNAKIDFLQIRKICSTPSFVNLQN